MKEITDMVNPVYSEISDFLTETWNIAVNNVTELSEGSAQCFKIESDDKFYFFKVYQEKFSRELLLNEISVCDFLKNKGFCVSEFQLSVKENYIEEFCGKLCTLQIFIEGVTFHKFELPRNLLYECAKELAKINNALEDLPFQLPAGFEDDRFGRSPSSEIEKYADLIAKLDCNDLNYNRIASDFESKCEMINGFDPTAFDFSSLSFENSHGDYNVLQLIFSENGIKAVIDFSSCARLPVSWELIRSYSLSSMECKNAIIDKDNFIGYINEYIKIRRLSESDLKLMPYFYLFTLLRSTFGYKDYIMKKAEGRSVDQAYINKLDFAFWRTEICKWLFDNADHLSSELQKCI